MQNKTNTQIRHENELHNVKVVIYVVLLIASVIVYSLVIVFNFPGLDHAPWHFRLFFAMPALVLCTIALYVAITEIK